MNTETQIVQKYREKANTTIKFKTNIQYSSKNTNRSSSAQRKTDFKDLNDKINIKTWRILFSSLPPSIILRRREYDIEFQATSSNKVKIISEQSGRLLVCKIPIINPLWGLDILKTIDQSFRKSTEKNEESVSFYDSKYTKINYLRYYKNDGIQFTSYENVHKIKSKSIWENEPSISNQHYYTGRSVKIDLVPSNLSNCNIDSQNNNNAINKSTNHENRSSSRKNTTASVIKCTDSASPKAGWLSVDELTVANKSELINQSRSFLNIGDGRRGGVEWTLEQNSDIFYNYEIDWISESWLSDISSSKNDIFWKDYNPEFQNNKDKISQQDMNDNRSVKNDTDKIVSKSSSSLSLRNDSYDSDSEKDIKISIKHDLWYNVFSGSSDGSYFNEDIWEQNSEKIKDLKVYNPAITIPKTESVSSFDSESLSNIVFSLKEKSWTDDCLEMNSSDAISDDEKEGLFLIENKLLAKEQSEEIESIKNLIAQNSHANDLVSYGVTFNNKCEYKFESWMRIVEPENFLDDEFPEVGQANFKQLKDILLPEKRYRISGLTTSWSFNALNKLAKLTSTYSKI